MLKVLKKLSKFTGTVLEFCFKVCYIRYGKKVKRLARQARIKDPYGTFHITQSGGKNRVLFEGDDDRKHFLEILRRAQSKFQFRLYAYCLLSDNTYHLVLDLNGADMSKVMKSINIGYAMYLDTKEPLFKDRYKSTLLEDTASTENVIKKIHEKGDRETVFNSFCTYDLTSPLKLDWVSPLTDFNKALNEEDCRNCIETIDEAQKKLFEVTLEREMSLTELLKEKELRNELILKFRKNSTLSLKELGSLFGGLSESSICKILNTACEK